MTTQTSTYRGYKIIVDTDDGYVFTYIDTSHLDGGDMIEVADVKTAKAVIDEMIRDLAEYTADCQ